MWLTIPHALENIAFLRDLLSKVHLAAHWGGKIQYCHLIFPSAKPLNINDKSLRIPGYGDLLRRRSRTTDSGDYPCKGHERRNTDCTDRRGHRATCCLKAVCAPLPVLQDRNPSHLDLCEDFGWWGRTPCHTEAGHQVDSALQLETQFCSDDSTWSTRWWSRWPCFQAGCLDNDSLCPNGPVQCHLYSDFLLGPTRDMSAVFLIRTHWHARHGHGGHGHLSQVTTTAVHVHHVVCCRVPLGSKLLLGKRAIPGQVP